MATRSLNKVQLIGNLTRDPELRYTPQGNAVCTFGLATNRQWSTDTGEKKEEADFHRVVAWNKLAEICSQLLSKGRRIYIEGRLSTRSWTGQDGAQRQTTEIVAQDMIILDNKGMGVASGGGDLGTTEEVSVEEVMSEETEEGKAESGKPPLASLARLAESKRASGGGKAKESKKDGSAGTSAMSSVPNGSPQVEDKSEDQNPDEMPF